MATRKIVPRADNEGGVGTSLKRWASAFINALTADSATIGTLSGIVKAAAGVLSATALGTARQIFGMNDAGTLPEYMTFPKFSANKNVVDQTIISATWTKVTFTTEVYDEGSKYDAPNSRWIPGIIGKAHIVAGGSFLNMTDQALLGISIYKNGAEHRTALKYASAAGRYQGDRISVDVLIDVITDYFEVFAYQSSGINQDLEGTLTYTFFSGHMLP